MRSQLQLQQGEGSESEEDENDEGGKRDLWGAKKGQYYEQGEVVSYYCFQLFPRFHCLTHAESEK